MDKRFTVAVEMSDGTRRELALQGADSKTVFQLAKETPGVRRVGKVSEVGGSATQSVRRGEASNPGPMRAAVASAATNLNAAADHRKALLGLTIAGPRVVVSDRRVGVEQPFKHLQVTPESIEAERRVAEAKRLEEARKAEEARRAAEEEARRVAEEARVLAEQRAAAEAAIIAAGAAQAAAATARAEAEAAENDAENDDDQPYTEPSEDLEHRVIKSRRSDGPPFFVQRGRWRERGGKRTFKVEWEKGFDEREQAERHLEWVAQTRRDLAEMNAD